MQGACAIYGSVRSVPSEGEVGALLPGASCERLAGEPGDWTRLALQLPGRRVVLSRLERGSEGHALQLRALAQLVLQASGERLDPRGEAALRKVTGAHHVVGVACDPPAPGGVPLPRELAGLVRGMAQALNGVVLREARLLDSELRVFVDPAGAPDPEAGLLDLPSARARREASEARLAELEVEVATRLPCLPGDEETMLRAPREVAERAQALWALAARASGEVTREGALDLLVKRELWAAATPREQALLGEEALEPALATRLTWRLEGLWALLWALRQVDELALPQARVTLERVTRQLVARPAHEFVSGARLRDAAEILDAADFIYRCHGALGDALLRQQAPPAGLLPRAVQEQHMALFWLIGYLGQSWDALTAEPDPEPEHPPASEAGA